MCGRFNVISSPLTQLVLDIIERNSVDEVPGLPLPTRLNIAPTNPVTVIRRDGDDWQLSDMRWWLVPS